MSDRHLQYYVILSARAAYVVSVASVLSSERYVLGINNSRVVFNIRIVLPRHHLGISLIYPALRIVNYLVFELFDALAASIAFRLTNECSTFHRRIRPVRIDRCPVVSYPGKLRIMPRDRLY